MQHQKLHPPVQREVFVRHGRHEVLQHCRVGGVQRNARPQQAFVGDEQYRHVRCGRHGHRAFCSPAARQNVREDAARPHARQRKRHAVRRLFFRLDLSAEHHAQLLRLVPGQQQHLAL